MMNLSRFLLTPYVPEKRTLSRAALYSLLLLFAAHAFCFFNLTYSSGSVMLSVSSGRGAQIAAGAYLQPFYWRIRGSISSPLFVGMLSSLYLTLVNLVLVWLLQLAHPVSLFALCGAITANAAVLSICAASVHTADAIFLSLLLAALACACCMRIRLGVIPAVMLLTPALALDPQAFAFFAAMALIVMLSDLLLRREIKAFALGALRLGIALAASAALYMLGFMLMLRRNGADAAASFQLLGGDPVSAYLAPIRALLSPLTAYPHVSVIIRVLLVLACICLLVRRAASLGKGVSALLAASMLVLPLLSSLTLLSAQADVQITMAHCLLDAAVIMLLSRLMPDRAALCNLAAAAFAVLFTGCIVFSNQVYLKKNLEFESTLSLMSRIIARMEETPGYEIGYTPVAFIGTPEESVFSVERKGFEHLSALDAAAANYAIANTDDMIWYMWDVMGYPINVASAYDAQLIAQSPQCASMPAYPRDGFCSMIDGTLVVKLQ